jgi:uncharacterized membrane protein
MASPPVDPQGITVAWSRYFLLMLAAVYVCASLAGERAVALGVVGIFSLTLCVLQGWLVAALGLMLAAAAVAILQPGWLRFALYLPPLAAFAFMAAFFGRTLHAGREPLITAVARREHPDLPARLRIYTRRLTWIWTLGFVALFFAALVLAPVLDFGNWARWVQGLGYVVPLVLLLGEYGWRRLTLREFQHASLPVLLHNIFLVMRSVVRNAPAGRAS